MRRAFEENVDTPHADHRFKAGTTWCHVLMVASVTVFASGVPAAHSASVLRISITISVTG
ncbi:MAG: hypothetical protein HIU83_13070 [Proteobacteria bacterium]|nr:hypothetical protein [Pseudomonadota bacterium]